MSRTALVLLENLLTWHTYNCPELSAGLTELLQASFESIFFATWLHGADCF